MEYALGSIITIAVIILTNLYFKKYPIEKPTTVRYSQSHIFMLVSPFLPTNYEMAPRPITQASKFLEETQVKVAFIGNEAYWIKDGKFYVAKVVKREIQHDTATQVDTMSMDKIQLDKIMLVVEQLTKGTPDDYRNAR